MYSSARQYLQLMANPHAYAGCLEIVAAQFSTISSFQLPFTLSKANYTLLLQVATPAMICIFPLPRTMYILRYNAYSLIPFFSFRFASCQTPLLLLRRRPFKRLSGRLHALPPGAPPIEACVPTFVGSAPSTGFIPSSPAKTKKSERLQAQFTITFKQGKKSPRPSRRRVAGLLPIHLRLLRPT